MMIPDPPSNVQNALAALPPAARKRTLQLRSVIFGAAASAGVTPLLETLKWGQPSYLPSPKAAGTTIRLGWCDTAPTVVGLYVHCQTDLVSRYQDIYGAAFSYDGTRGVLIPVSGKIPTDAVHQMAAMALTYHKQKRINRRAS